MIELEVERLLCYALGKGLIDPLDTIMCRNALLDLLGLPAPYDGEPVAYANDTATEVLENMLDCCAERGLLISRTAAARDLFAARIMGLLTPRQSDVVRRFRANYGTSPDTATREFYRFCRATHYIQSDRVSKDVRWSSPTEFGELQISINLSKPEKDPRDIAAAKDAQQAGYPKCLLCAENVGFAGNAAHPARQNHRTIPLVLHGETWHFQYSPYVYYNEHCIVLDELHRPMKLGEATFRRLTDFTEQFPHYFIGSNADLPIVGGSILSHDHFQGGRHTFPMETAPAYKHFSHAQYAHTSVKLVKWPMSVIRLADANKIRVVHAAMHILEGWRGYADPAADILPHTDGTPHNTVTPITRRNAAGLFEMDIVLRNNRTTDEHPLGLFHPHADLHHIKKENIGLIEVMGLAVLPGRLLAELEGIAEVLQGNASAEPARDPAHPLHKHLGWMSALCERHGTGLSRAEAQSIIQDEVAAVFAKVLADAGVFKHDEKGIRNFVKFMDALGFRETAIS
ncbi:MAG: UDP-glucose--hexose-1-phosphate uridylyltransferase [Defluviitaleaceae bacterium]|nr:UDP-glucose--hexose-1-phosphate uridylyltransferase [Defluviitaleaceae bacterium]